MTKLNSDGVEEAGNGDKKIKPKYVSKDGFEIVKVRRGFTEIQALFDLLLERMVRGDCCMCGGYIRYMCSPHTNPAKPGDLDIYFSDWDSYNETEAQLRVEGFEKKFENDVSLSFKIVKDVESKYFGTPVVQLIKPIEDGAIMARGIMEDIIKNFDFTVIRCGLINSQKALVDADFMHDEAKKILRIKNIHCPISSTLRCMKYSRKGYWLPPLQCCRLFIDWEDRDEEYRNKIYHFLVESDKGEGLTRQEIEEMERLMRID
jgi:hypothetical protein